MLSPALAALLLKSHDSKPDKLTILLNALFGKWLFTPFNKVFDKGANGYQKLVQKLIRMSVLVGFIYIALVGGTITLFNKYRADSFPHKTNST